MTDDTSFYLYGVGEKPEALTLGSLVLEKYWQPLIARHYTHDLLSDDELQKHAHVSQLNNVVFRGTSRISPSIGIDAGDIINLSLAYKRDLERIVVAERGTRIIVKDPETLLTAVLNNSTAQQKLKLWLSAARSSYVLNFKFARRPKIWLLTGLYLLEGTRTVVSRSHSSRVSHGISSSLVGALSGVPIGGSVSLSQGSEWELDMEVPDKHVWAAQYRLVDARFLKLGTGEEPRVLGLYRDVMSVNTVRGGGKDGVEVSLSVEEDDDDDGDHDAESEFEDDESDEFEKRLEEAIRVFEGAPKHFLK